jgi:hypothetical protein
MLDFHPYHVLKDLHTVMHNVMRYVIPICTNTKPWNCFPTFHIVVHIVMHLVILIYSTLIPTISTDTLIIMHNIMRIPTYLNS